MSPHCILWYGMVLYFIWSYCTVSQCYVPLLQRAGELPRSASSHFLIFLVFSDAISNHDHRAQHQHRANQWNISAILESKLDSVPELSSVTHSAATSTSATSDAIATQPPSNTAESYPAAEVSEKATPATQEEEAATSEAEPQASVTNHQISTDLSCCWHLHTGACEDNVWGRTLCQILQDAQDGCSPSGFFLPIYICNHFMITASP